MANQVELVEVELSQHRVIPTEYAISPVESDSSLTFRALLRWYGTPLGTVDAPTASQLISNSFPYYNGSLYLELLRDRLTQSQSDRNPNAWRIEQALQRSPHPIHTDLTVTIAYCFSQTQVERSDRHALLDSLVQQTHRALQILLIEYDCDRNASIDPVIQTILDSNSNFGYYAIAQPDLISAQQLALAQFSGDVISFVDDRTVLDVGWAAATAKLFDRNPEVRIMTGLTLPIGQSSENQVPYENLYGLACGFTRRWIQWTKPPTWMELGVMQYGSPMNFAIHRHVVSSISEFSWAALTQALLQGELLVYEPRSIVRHRLPETLSQVEQATYAGMRSFYTYLRTSWALSPHLRLQFLTLGLWKFTRVLGAWVKTYGLPRRWFTAELKGIWDSFTIPLTPLERGDKKGNLGESWELETTLKVPLPKGDLGGSGRPSRKVSQVFTLELSQPIAPLYAPDAESVRIYIQWCDRLLGYVTIHHAGQPIGIDRIADAIIDQHLSTLLAIPFPDRPNVAWQASEQAIAQYFAPPTKPIQRVKPPAPLPNTVSVSIIVPTCDRPEDLRHCLEHLQQIKPNRPIEIIVADNRPHTGSAAKVLQDFPGVKLIEEPRVGSSYARNAAIVASSGDIVVTVDDDVTVPSEWLEKLIVPFNRPEVMSVCGGVLPLVLDTPAQAMFESVKGGLCFGFETREADKAWLDSFHHGVPPIWELGVSANAAFRSTIFSNPTIGLMEETLGAGTPAGGAEENHYAYKILRSGGTIVYDPSAYVWHHHRRTLLAFYKQVQGQMGSCAPLNLTIWLQEGDRRGRQQLLVNMPRYFLQCWRDRLFHRSKTPWKILFLEIKGYAIGFWAYWESQRLVKQQGRSDRYVRRVDRT